MLEKIVSGGQTGVDRAALDVALERGMPCGGWCPKGRLAEDGTIPARYPLTETPSEIYAQRTEWNVRDSNGTLVLTRGRPSEGTAFTIETAAKWKKPYLVIDLGPVPSPHEDLRVAALSWISQHDIRVLNIAGPRESKCPGIHEETRKFLKAMLEGLR